MPYAANEDLPAPVKSHLPRHAQDIYREAFNHAYAEYKGDRRQEEISHRVGWAAVKKVYRKDGDEWVRREARERAIKAPARARRSGGRFFPSPRRNSQAPTTP